MRRPYVILAACVIAELGALWPPPSFFLTDHLIFWNVGRLYAMGGSPYDRSAWSDLLALFDNVNVRFIVGRAGDVWPYPPWTGYLFVPFGLISLPAGLFALHAAYLAAGLGAGIWIVRSLTWRTWTAPAIALILVPTFQPFVYAERLGHFAAFLLIGVAAVAVGVRSRSSVALAAGALLLFTKPQVVPLFGLVVLALLVRDRRWRQITITTAALVLAAAASVAAHPEGLAVAVAGGTSRLSLLAPDSINPIPDVWTLALTLAGDAWPLLAAGLVGVAVWACAAAVRWSPPDLKDATLLSGSIVVSLFVVPYVFSYDQLLLVPAIALVVVAADRLPARRRGPRLALIVAVVIVAPWILFFAGVASGDHVLSALVPLGFAGLLALAMAPFRAGAPVPTTS